MKPRYTKEQLEKAVKESKCYSDILRKLGLSTVGSCSRTSIKKYCKLWNISLSHLLTISEFNKLNTKNIKRIPIENILVENSSYLNMATLKNRLCNEKGKKRLCELCGQGELWRGKKMSLILDHINGNHVDNRYENLRFVCPNCNATLETHCSKNKKGQC